jgi:Tfp pilus assembly protein PilF
MQIKLNRNAVGLATLGIWLLISMQSIKAAPYIPATDGEIIDQSTSNTGKAAAALVRETRRAHAVLNQQKNNLDLALRIAQHNMRRARIESDPRYLGQAEAALAPWLNQTTPPVSVLVLRANIRQSLHQFALARLDLEQVVAREPRNAQGWLTLATVAQVTGDTATARKSCSRLTGLTDAAVQAACTSAIDGATGRATPAAAALTQSLQSSRRLNREQRGWIATLQAELAERVGHINAAEKYYRQAVALDPRDAFATAAYADFLLDQRRAGEVLKLIPAATDSDILHLRRVLAAHDLKLADAAAMADRLAMRYAIARTRSDQLHLREEARFILHVRGQPAAALALAITNWQIQKEPADLRLLLEAAVAAGQRPSADIALAWLDGTRLEGRAMAQLAAKARRL